MYPIWEHTDNVGFMIEVEAGGFSDWGMVTVEGQMGDASAWISTEADAIALRDALTKAIGDGPAPKFKYVNPQVEAIAKIMWEPKNPANTGTTWEGLADLTRNEFIRRAEKVNVLVSANFSVTPEPDPDDGLIEAMAQAIRGLDDDAWYGLSEDMRESWRRDARRALNVMRDFVGENDDE